MSRSVTASSYAFQKRIVVGLSGGVDSSVAATLLLEQGYRVEGAFMKNWEDDDSAGYCPAEQDFQDAKSVCEQLGVSLQAVNFSKAYRDSVFSHFLKEYRAGRTPNPDILCNKEIKFKLFLEYALSRGAELIATGHYAQVIKKNGRFQLLKAKDQNKDQSYFLYTLGQQQLSRTLFPLGELEKTEVRAIAKRNGLITHAKKDSTGICFIGERNFREFLSRYLPAQPGEMYTPEGMLIGQHAGLMYYTLGQRQGLGIGGRSGALEGKPWYVAGKDIVNNRLYVSQGLHPMLYSSVLEANQLHWVAGEPVAPPFRCKAKIRYRQTEQACIITRIDNNNCQVIFDKPQQAATPGQSVVFYHGDECLGGAVIEHTNAPSANIQEQQG